MVTTAASRQPVPVPPSLLAVATRVEDRLAVVLDAEVERWAELSDDLVPPLESLRALVMAGGKRLRPAFCYWGYVGAGGNGEDEAVIDAGAAFELLQAFALVHDDVMDGSATRRGSRTAHLHYRDRHDQAAWRGEGRRFGEGVAILIGDLAHVYADRLLERAPAQVMPIWNELRIELNIGQYLDILGTARADTNIEGARRIARYKSGKYTIERPLHIGAALAGRLGALQEQLSAYGDPLGEAFQLRDDILGVFGETALTGKPVGDDLREGKPTPLIALATEAADPAQADVLSLVGGPRLSSEQVAAVQAVMIDTGALARVEDLIEQLVAEAVGAIEEAEITDEARAELITLAHFVGWRHA